MSDNDFLARVLARVPPADRPLAEYSFQHWSAPGKATDEALGVLPVAGVDAAKLMARVMDLAHYAGPIPHVV